MPAVELLGGRYRLVERLGAGGMSVVWRGHDQVLGRQVAIKVLDHKLAGDSAFRHRILVEAQAAARLSHPNITNVYDYGELTDDPAAPVPYVVMELVDGQSLSSRLGAAGSLAWPAAVAAGAQIAAALSAAHQRGVVHRDVTPGNVMLTSTGAKVVDFGISALVGERDADPDGNVLGTPAYLAPERLGDGVVLPATDVYGLGLLLYRCLTGRLPWHAATTTQMLRAHAYTEPAPMPPVDGLPAEVAELCHRCLAKNPDDRPTSAEVAKVLTEVAARAPTVELLGPASEEAPPAPADGTASATVGTTILSWSTLTDALPSWSAPTRSGLGTLAAVGGGMAIVTGSAGVGFTGSATRLARPPSPPWRSLDSWPRWLRHRETVAAAAVLLLTGLMWTLTGGSAQQPADAAPTEYRTVSGTAALGARPVACRVEYRMRPTSDSTFAATLAVVNIGTETIPDARLRFQLPGDQVVTATGGGLDQSGRTVTATATDQIGQLEPGATARLGFTAGYDRSNAMPVAFTVNGTECATVLYALTPVSSGGSGDDDRSDRSGRGKGKGGDDDDDGDD